MLHLNCLFPDLWVKMSLERPWGFGMGSGGSYYKEAEERPQSPDADTHGDKCFRDWVVAEAPATQERVQPCPSLASWPVWGQQC